MKNVTIHDIAQQAKVSIATVSRVINRHNGVGSKTAARVRRVIARTGYIPDSIARGMRRRKSYAVGYIVSDISNVHFTVAAKHLEETLARAGYSLVVCSTGGDRRREADLLHLMLAKQIDGLVINVSGTNNDLVCDISRRLPVVLLSRKIVDPAFNGDFVGSDAFQGAYDLGRHVAAMGHRRIGLIRGPQTISTGSERYGGFVAALKEEGLELDEELVYPGDYYQESGRDGAEHLLHSPRPPSILVVMNNMMALGVLIYLKQGGFSVPGDVSFAAYGNIANRELLYVSPDAIGEKPDQEGALAGELLLRRIADRDAAPVTALVPGELLIGNSIRRL